MSPSRAPIGRVEWTRWVAAMACRCGRSTHGDNYAPRSDVQGSTPPPRRRRGACESSQVFQLVACARPAAAASRARPDPDIRLGSGMVIRRESVPPSGQARRGLRPRVRLTCLGPADPPYWGGSSLSRPGWFHYIGCITNFAGLHCTTGSAGPSGCFRRRRRRIDVTHAKI